MKDILIVGFGLAGLSIAKHADDMNLIFDVISDDSQKSSKVAGGLLNPVAVKRMKPVWKVEEFLTFAKEYYKSLESSLGTKIYFEKYIKVVIHNVEEENSWYESYDKPRLKPYIFKDIVINDSKHLSAHSFGLIKGAIVNLEGLFDKAKQFYISKNKYLNQSFNHSKLVLHDDHIEYDGLPYKHIFFCEGYGVLYNPYFNNLGVYGNKGDYLIIEAGKLKLDYILKSKYFLIPIGNDFYKFGATYQRQPLDHSPSKVANIQMVEALEKMINVPYKIVNQVCGIRPTTKDRKPILGSHKSYNNLHILNGLGSRGVMTSPLLGKNLLTHVFEEGILDPEVSIQRIYART